MLNQLKFRKTATTWKTSECRCSKARNLEMNKPKTRRQIIMIHLKMQYHQLKIMKPSLVKKNTDISILLLMNSWILIILIMQITNTTESFVLKMHWMTWLTLSFKKNNSLRKISLAFLVTKYKKTLNMSSLITS